MAFDSSRLGSVPAEVLNATSGVVQVAVFGGDAMQQNQSEALDDPFDKDFADSRAIKPPFDITGCINALDASTRLKSLIHVLVRNTVGLGFYFDLPPTVDPLVKTKLDTKTLEERFRLQFWWDHCNPEMPAVEVMSRVAWDRHTTGNGYYEVTRNGSGKPSGLYHLHCQYMRVLEDREGFVQVLDNGMGRQSRKYFKNYGDPRVMNKNTGVFDPATPENERATEVIHRRTFQPGSMYYGKPRWLSALDTVLLVRRARTWNLNFVTNNAAWPIAIITENAELGNESQAILQNLVNRKGKGIQGAGQVVLLQAQKKHPAQRGTDTRIRIEKLALGVQDDGSFLKLVTAGDEEIRECFCIAPLYLGASDGLNRASAAIAKLTTSEQEFNPLSTEEEMVLDATINRDLGAKFNVLKFRRPKILDPVQESQILARAGAAAVVTGQEVRNYLNGIMPGLNLVDKAAEDWGALPPAVMQQQATLAVAMATAEARAKQAADSEDPAQQAE